MGLQPETVYEALKSGVSQGLFTTVGAAHGMEGWFADGKWRSNAQIEAEKAKAKAEAEKKAQKASEEPINSGPPRLKRPGDSSPQSSSPSQPSAKSPQTAAPAGSMTPAPASGASASSASSSKDSPAKEDPNRPLLRRQPPSETSREQTKETTEPLKEPIQFVPAVSDADGP